MRVSLLISVLLASFLLPASPSNSLGQQGSAAAKPAAPQLTSLPASVLDAELRSARGRSFKLSDYAGKVLVVNLWATWVAPSRMEIPELVRLQAKFWSRGVRVVGLSTEDPDESAKQLHDFVRQFGIQYKIGWVPEQVAGPLFQERDVLPQTYVISPTGRIVKHFVGFNPTNTPLQLKAAIEEALKENAVMEQPSTQ